MSYAIFSLVRIKNGVIFFHQKLYNIYKSTIVQDYVLHRHIIYLRELILVINMLLR
jgi:hypothetical protein